MSTEPRRKRGSPGDRKWWRRENAYRDFWLLVLSAFVVWTALLVVGASNDAKDAGTKALNASRAAKAASADAKRTAEAIQRSRVQATRETCQAQNHRHDKTLKRLRELIAETPDPQEKARAQRNLAGTITIIDALVPKQDCETLVVKRVRLH